MLRRQGYGPARDVGIHRITGPRYNLHPSTEAHLGSSLTCNPKIHRSTANHGRRGLTPAKWPRTFWDPDPAPRSPRIQGPVTDAKFMDSRLHSRYRSSGVYIHHPRGNFIANCQLGPFPGPSSRRSRVQDQLLGTARVQRLSGQGEHSSQLPAHLLRTRSNPRVHPASRAMEAQP